LGLSPFAHLAGFRSAPKAAAAEDDSPKDRDAEDDDKDPKDDATSEDDKGTKSKAAEDDGSGDKDKDKDDGEDDAKASASFAAGAKAERKRCAAIFGAEEAGANPAFAAHLAFNTSISAADAIGMMQASAAGAPAPAAAKGGLDQRMSGQPAVRLAADAPAGGGDKNSPQALAASIVNTLARTRGQK
jgi:hypothetical protein